MLINKEIENAAPQFLILNQEYKNILFHALKKNVKDALTEDIGLGDLTAQLLANDKRCVAHVIAKEDAILCGTPWFINTMQCVDPDIHIDWYIKEGGPITVGTCVCKIEGNSKAILSAERTALNFLQLLSGIATQTSHYVNAVAGTKTQIFDTRKTLPGLRLAEKYAVRIGGGHNQRLGLYDAILIKENHIATAGSISAILKLAQVDKNFDTKDLATPIDLFKENESKKISRESLIAVENISVQIEVENIAQLEEALNEHAQSILLDNFSLKLMQEAVNITAGRALLEVSGGICLESVADIAKTGVDRISIGALTKNVRAIDFSMRIIC